MQLILSNCAAFSLDAIFFPAVSLELQVLLCCGKLNKFSFRVLLVSRPTCDKPLPSSVTLRHVAYILPSFKGSSALKQCLVLRPKGHRTTSVSIAHRHGSPAGVRG